MTMEQKIKRFVTDSGAAVCGIADIAQFVDAPAGFRPTDLFARCRSVVVFGLALPRALMRIEPHLLYMKAMGECLAELDRLAFLCAVWLERQGGEALPLPSDDPCDYWDKATQTAKGVLSMKHAAQCAGLGRIGKNTLLINPLYGNRLMLGAVLSDLALSSDPPAPSLCPVGCRICLDNCPQGALDGITLEQSRCRGLIYGKNALGHSVCNCNLCRRLCPHALRRPPLRDGVRSPPIQSPDV